VDNNQKGICGVKAWKLAALFFAGAMAGGIFFDFLRIVLSGDDFISQLHGVITTPPKENLSEKDKLLLYHLIEQGHILSPNDLIENIIAHYSSLIEFLMLIVSAIGIIAFMYIKGESTSKAEEVAENTSQKIAEKAAKEVAKTITSQHLSSNDFKVLSSTAFEKIAAETYDGYSEDLDETITKAKGLSETVVEMYDKMEVIQARADLLDELIPKLKDTISQSEVIDSGLYDADDQVKQAIEITTDDENETD